MSTATRLLTADDLWNMPGHGRRCELVKGELRSMSPAGFDHGSVSMNLSGPLHQYVRSRRLGIVVAAETGFIIARNPDTVRAPDVAFVKMSRVPASGIPTKYWLGAPDLAVETVSPSTDASDVDEKVREWLAAGTLLVWVLDPRKRTAAVYGAGIAPRTLGASELLEGGDVVPGFQISVAEIFTV